MAINTIITVVLVIGMIIWFIDQSRRKTKYGLNFKRVYCPICKTKLPIIRKPLNERQKQYGGWTCPNCTTELDKYGDEV